MSEAAWSPEELAAARAAEQSARARRAALPTEPAPPAPIAPKLPPPPRAPLRLVVRTPEQLAQDEERRLEAERLLEAAQRRRDAEADARAVRRALDALPRRYSLDLDAPELRARVQRPGAIDESRAAVLADAAAVVWTGPSGSGKSTLAGAAARAYVRRNIGARALMVRAASLATASRYHALGAGAPEALIEAERADLLVLDELGEALRSAQWDDVAEVVFARYERQLPTWVTTWMSVEQVAGAYGDGFARRIFERARVIACGGGMR